MPYPGTAKYTDEHHQVLMGAVDRAVAAAAAAGEPGRNKYVGFATGNVAFASDAVGRGASWIQIGADKVMLRQRFEQLADEQSQLTPLLNEQRAGNTNSRGPAS